MPKPASINTNPGWSLNNETAILAWRRPIRLFAAIWKDIAPKVRNAVDEVLVEDPTPSVSVTRNRAKSTTAAGVNQGLKSITVSCAMFAFIYEGGVLHVHL